MKRYMALVLALVCVSGLAGCGDGKSTDEGNRAYFEATVIEVGDSQLLVEPSEGTEERRSSDRIAVSTGGLEGEPSIDYLAGAEVGDVVQIGYSGQIAESYPAQIDSAFEITLVASGDSSTEPKSDSNSTEDFRLNTDEGDVKDRCGVRDGEKSPQ